MKDRAKLQEYRQLLKSNGCEICGYNTCVSSLVYHHVVQDAKGRDMTETCTFKQIKEEAAKCIVVCANCHGEIHAGMHKDQYFLPSSGAVEDTLDGREQLLLFSPT
jgi:hypothetical protein